MKKNIQGKDILQKKDSECKLGCVPSLGGSRSFRKAPDCVPDPSGMFLVGKG